MTTVDRVQAERNYKAVLAVWNKLSNGNTEAEWLQANANLAAARNALVNAEMASPTQAEVKRAETKRWRNNIGLGE